MPINPISFAVGVLEELQLEFVGGRALQRFHVADEFDASGLQYRTSAGRSGASK